MLKGAPLCVQTQRCGKTVILGPFRCRLSLLTVIEMGRCYRNESRDGSMLMIRGSSSKSKSYVVEESGRGSAEPATSTATPAAVQKLLK